MHFVGAARVLATPPQAPLVEGGRATMRAALVRPERAALAECVPGGVEVDGAASGVIGQPGGLSSDGSGGVAPVVGDLAAQWLDGPGKPEGEVGQQEAR